LQEILLGDLDHSRYRTLNDIDRMVLASADAVAAYQREAPELFKAGTDFITKSLGFADPAFRAGHGFAARTRQAFTKFDSLVKRVAR
jgi:putative GTP pyrophosphokinase